MASYLDTTQDIEDFLQVFSDPYGEQGKAPSSPEPQVCMPGTADQQGASQSQEKPASRPSSMTEGCCDVPGAGLSTQDAAAAPAPDEDLQALLEHLTELFEQKSQASSGEQAQPTAVGQNSHVTGLPDITLTDDRNTLVPANEVSPASAGHGQRQDLQREQTLNGMQMAASCTGLGQTFTAYQPCSGVQMPVPVVPQILYCGPQAAPALGQSLYLQPMPSTWNGHGLPADQTPTFHSGLTPGRSQQLVAVPHQGLTVLPASPGLQGQLPAESGHCQTMIYPLPKKPQTLKPYVCPHQHCGKSYWRAAQLRIHQRTHSGRCGFGDSGGPTASTWESRRNACFSGHACHRLLSLCLGLFPIRATACSPPMLTTTSLSLPRRPEALRMRCTRMPLEIQPLR